MGSRCAACPGPPPNPPPGCCHAMMVSTALHTRAFQFQFQLPAHGCARANTHERERLHAPLFRDGVHPDLQHAEPLQRPEQEPRLARVVVHVARGEALAEIAQQELQMLVLPQQRRPVAAQAGRVDDLLCFFLQIGGGGAEVVDGGGTWSLVRRHDGRGSEGAMRWPPLSDPRSHAKVVPDLERKWHETPPLFARSVPFVAAVVDAIAPDRPHSKVRINLVAPSSLTGPTRRPIPL